MATPTSDLLLLEEDELQLELALEDSVQPQWPHLWEDEGYLTSWEERACD